MGRGLVGRVIRAAAGHALIATLTVVAAVSGMQLLLELAPGDAIDRLPNPAEVRAVLEAQWGLDRPVWARIVATLTGDLGTSVALHPGQPVSELIAAPLARSASWWTGAGAALVATATWTATRRERPRRAASLLFGAASLLPVFLLAHVVVAGMDESVFALEARGLIGRPAWFPLPLEPSAVRFAVAVGVLALGSTAYLDAHAELSARVDRLREAPFAVAARSRGEREASWLWRHLAVAVAELVASRAAVLLGGLVILEKVLLLNGAGSALWDAAIARDHTVAMALTAAFAAWVALTRAAADTARDALCRGETSS